MKRSSKHALQAAITAVTLCTTPACANETALYSEAAPADAAFVRLLGDVGSATGQVSFGGQTLATTAMAPDTYVAISASTLTGVAPGSYHSLSPGADGLIAIEEPPRETAAKVHLILVNVAKDPVRLILLGPGAEVVAPVAAGSASSRSVNPVSATLAVERTTDGAILGSFDVTLARGQNVTFVAGADTSRVLENHFGPVLKFN